MGQVDARLAPLHLEPLEVGRDKVDEKRESQGVAAREDGGYPPCITAALQNEVALKPAGLRLPETFVNLGESPKEYKQRAQHQQDNGELQGGENFPETVTHG